MGAPRELLEAAVDGLVKVAQASATRPASSIDKATLAIEAVRRVSRAHPDVPLRPETLSRLIKLLREEPATVTVAAITALAELIAPSPTRAAQIARNPGSLSALVEFAVNAEDWTQYTLTVMKGLINHGYLQAVVPHAVALVETICREVDLAIRRANARGGSGLEAWDFLEVAWGLCGILMEISPSALAAALRRGADLTAASQLPHCKTPKQVSAIATIILSMQPQNGAPSVELRRLLIQGISPLTAPATWGARTYVCSRPPGSRGSIDPVDVPFNRDTEDAQWYQAWFLLVDLLGLVALAPDTARLACKTAPHIFHDLGLWIAALTANQDRVPHTRLVKASYRALADLFMEGGGAAARAVASARVDQLGLVSAVASSLREGTGLSAGGTVQVLRRLCRQARLMSQDMLLALVMVLEFITVTGPRTAAFRVKLMCFNDIMACGGPQQRRWLCMYRPLPQMLANSLAAARSSRGFDAATAAEAAAAALVATRLAAEEAFGARALAEIGKIVERDGVGKGLQHDAGPPTSVGERGALLIELWRAIRPPPDGASAEEACAAAKLGARAAAALARCALHREGLGAVALAFVTGDASGMDRTLCDALNLYTEANTALAARGRGAATRRTSGGAGGSSSEPRPLPAMAASPLLHATCANLLQLLLRLSVLSIWDVLDPGPPMSYHSQVRGCLPGAAASALSIGEPIWRGTAGCPELTALAMMALAPFGELEHDETFMARERARWEPFLPLLRAGPSAGAGCLCCGRGARAGGEPWPDGATLAAKAALDDGPPPPVGVLSGVLAAAQERLTAPRDAWCESIEWLSKQAPQQPQQQQQQREEEGQEQQREREQESSSPAANAPLACAVCGETGDDGTRLKVCCGCRRVRYCGYACARVDWVRRGHRRDCEPARAAAGGGGARASDGRSAHSQG